MIYFDNAATTFPKPPQVARAVSSAVTRFGGNPGRSGHAMSLRAAQMVYECREKAAKLFGCEEAERVIFVKNCTEATNFAIKGYLPENSHVIYPIWSIMPFPDRFLHYLSEQGFVVRLRMW